MPKPPRFVHPDAIYHFTCRGNNKMTLFHRDADFDEYLRILRKYKKEVGFSLFHYCLMSNHVHLIMQPNEDSPAKLMQCINQAYGRCYRKRYSYTGHVWQGRYHSSIISKDSYLQTCGFYVELNPVRAKMTRTPEEYPRSTYRHYALGELNDLIDDDPLFLELAPNQRERRKEYVRLASLWAEDASAETEASS